MTQPASLLIFWTSAALVAYVYVGYPLIVAALARPFGRPAKRTGDGDPRPSVSIVIAAFNEAGTIGRRLLELSGRIAADGLSGELIVVDDGSTDGTAAVARGLESTGLVRLIELGTNRGKAAALTIGCAAATGEVVAFADARQTWAPDALLALLAPFADPSVGAVSGDLVVEAAPGVMAGVGLYWRYEKWLRANEGRLRSTVGVTGAISAVRRELFRPIPPGTILDDVYWPLGVAMQGRRVVHDPRPRAFDRLPERAGDEFRRKVRTLSGNFQLVARLPGVLLPWRNPIWLQFLSHKVGRLVAPWALIALFASGVALAAVSPAAASRAYLAATLAQAAMYLMSALGVAGLSRNKLSTVAASFLVLNAAAWAAFWVWASGRSARSWAKISYNVPPPAAPAAMP